MGELHQHITDSQLALLKQYLLPLVGSTFEMLSLPIKALTAFEPSQIGTIVGTLMDAMIPYLEDILGVGLEKHAGLIGEREGYPDYIHKSGFRLELKLLYVDNPNLKTKKPPTPREPSARLTQKVTVKNVNPATDAMLLIAYQLQPQIKNLEIASPRIIDIEVLSMIELIKARDKRLKEAGGLWFGDYETPVVLSKKGRLKLKNQLPLDTSSYGRKESEGKDFNEDTNFGKLARIPNTKLQRFLKKHLGQIIVENQEPNTQN